MVMTKGDGRMTPTIDKEVLRIQRERVRQRMRTLIRIRDEINAEVEDLRLELDGLPPGYMFYRLPLNGVGVNRPDGTNLRQNYPSKESAADGAWRDAVEHEDARAVRLWLLANPGATVKQVAEATGLKEREVETMLCAVNETGLVEVITYRDKRPQTWAVCEDERDTTW